MLCYAWYSHKPKDNSVHSWYKLHCKASFVTQIKDKKKFIPGTNCTERLATKLKSKTKLCIPGTNCTERLAIKHKSKTKKGSFLLQTVPKSSLIPFDCGLSFYYHRFLIALFLVLAVYVLLNLVRSHPRP
eukprot:887456-Rhodomonas_salina.1